MPRHRNHPLITLFPVSSIIVPGDATATANNIIASESLFRMSIVGWSVVLLTEVVLSVILYVLLKPVSNTLALVMMFARLAMTTIQGVNLLNHSLLYLAHSYGNILLPKYEEILAQVVLLTMIPELLFPLWLLIKGVKDRQPATTEAG